MKIKVKWPVRELVAKRQQGLLKRWLRHAEILRDDEEEMVHVCDREARRNLSDDEGKRSLEYLNDCQVSSEEILDCQLGNEMGSLDLIDYQVGRKKIPYCQEGKGEQMSS
jgi:hypothetical protein